MLYILWGQDDFSLNEALAEIKRGIGDQTVLLTNTTTLDVRQTTIDELTAVCETVPFLAEKRLVIVEGLLELFEPPKRNERLCNNQTGYHIRISYRLLVKVGAVH